MLTYFATVSNKTESCVAYAVRLTSFAVFSPITILTHTEVFFICKSPQARPIKHARITGARALIGAKKVKDKLS